MLTINSGSSHGKSAGGACTNSLAHHHPVFACIFCTDLGRVRTAAAGMSSIPKARQLKISCNAAMGRI